MNHFKIILLFIFSILIASCKGASEGNAPSGPSPLPDASSTQLSISPSTKTLSVNNSFNFTAHGGTAPYNFSIVSGGGIILTVADQGQLTAPATSGVVIVQLTDSTGGLVTATVTVNPALQISPVSQTIMTSGTLNMSSTGGVPPYFYSVASGLGSIDSLTGLYTASATNTVANIIVTDSLGNTSSSSITVTSALSLNPATANLVVNGNQTFSASGGTGPYSYSILSGGGSINSSTGVFTAPATANTVVVQVTDSLSATATSSVTVNPALTISPVTINLSVNGSLTFAASGGVAPRTFSILSGAGTVNSSSGLYTAPATAGSAVVRVTDSLGNTADSNINVTNSLGITPAAMTMAVNNTTQFSAVGGLAPFTYSILSGGGSINSSTGVFNAPATAGSVVVQVTDSLGSTANATVTVAAALTISPATITKAVNSTQTFSATGGVTPYTFSVVSGGGSINSSTGLFTAPATTSSVVVRVTDALSNTSNATITVVSLLTITPAIKTLAVNNTFSFSGTGGQSPYVYSVLSGGGSINSSTGLYTAPATIGSAVVRITDAIGQIADSNVTINSALSISPVTVTKAVNSNHSFSVAGGLAPYSFSIVSGGGSINSSTGDFTAPATSASVIVRVTDSLSNTSDSTVTVVNAVAITPATNNLVVNGNFTFSASGGLTPYSYSVVSGGGSINSTTGAYTAPAIPGSVIIRVTDALLQTSDSSVTVTSILTVSPVTQTISPSGTVTLIPAGGTAPYSFSVVSGGGSIHSSTGLYTAPATGTTAVLRVTDSMAQTADSTISVINATPVISAISDQTINEDGTSSVNFTISDTDSTLNCVTSMSATSSNSAIVPVSSVVFSGTAPNCTALVTPLANQNGMVTLTFSVTDAVTTAQDSFDLNITAINDAPVLSAISNQTLKSDGSLVLNYTLNDSDNSMNCSSSITVTSSLTSVLPLADIVKSGTAPNCILTITPSLNVAGTSTINLSATDGTLSDAKSFTTSVVSVSSIALSPTSLSIATGGTSQLVATALYSNSTSAVVTTSALALWSSSNAAVASVNTTTSKGLVTGVASGSANINLSYKGLSQSAATTVYTVTGVTVSTGSVMGGIGSQSSITATAQTTSFSFDVTSSAVWSSSNSSVATVNSSGVIQYVSAGTAVITATYAGFSATVNVTVQAKSLVSLALTISGGGTSIPVNGMKNLIATGTYSDSSTEVLTNTAVWSSSNNSVLTVSNTLPTIGKVTGVSGGTSTMTATIGSVSGTLLVTVNAVTLSSIAITPSTALVASGATYNLRATGTYSDSSTADITELVTWSSSNTTAATVSNVAGSKGLATAPVFTGYRSTTISAVLSSVTGTTVLGVNGATISSIVVTPTLSLTVNQSYSLKAYGNLSDGGVIDLTDFAIWSSSTVSRVSVSNALGSKGTVTAVSLGTSTITAAFNGINGTRVVTVAASSSLTEIGVGLTGMYYTWTGGPPPATPFLPANKKGERIDQKVNFAWGAGNAPMGVGEQFSVRWTGFYKATSTTNYFCSNSDDGIRIWINGTQVVNNWTEHGPMWDCTANIPMVVGTKYSIVIEYYENGGGSEAHFTRSSVSAADAQNTTTRAISQVDLYPN